MLREPGRRTWAGLWVGGQVDGQSIVAVVARGFPLKGELGGWVSKQVDRVQSAECKVWWPGLVAKLSHSVR